MNSSATLQPHWLSRSAFQIVIFLFLFTEMALWAVLFSGASLWWAVLLVLLASHLMHGAAVGFHEATHGLLRRNRTFNEFDGVLLGIFSFTSFSLYRAAHQTHHAHFATERDEELWPFVFTKTPRWVRVLVAVAELNAGLVYTPLLFLRSFLRRRIWSELTLMLFVWIGVLAAVSYFQVWRYLLWMYFAPAFVAGNLQSWRKYVEHVGLTGSTVNSATRHIVAKGWTGRLVAFTLLHEPFHGVHHLHLGLPHAELPQRVDAIMPRSPDERPPFPSYRHALVDVLRCLADPRVGAQWRGSAPQP